MNKEIRLYLDHAHRDLEAAESNLDIGFYHITLSRAYYAMFYAASALLASESITRSKHSGVISAFGQYFVKPGLIEPEYAKMIGNAFDSRLDSDYDLAFAVDKATAEDILRDAGRFVARIGRYLDEKDNATNTS